MNSSPEVSTSAAPETTTPPVSPPTSPTAVPASSSPASSSPAPTGGASGLTLTVGDKSQELTLTEVFCSGPPGSIRRAVGKTNNRPPIVEVDGQEFLLVKTSRVEPLKAPRPAGVSFTNDAVVFDQVSFVNGAGVLNGTMRCTSRQG